MSVALLDSQQQCALDEGWTKEQIAAGRDRDRRRKLKYEMDLESAAELWPEGSGMVRRAMRRLRKGAAERRQK